MTMEMSARDGEADGSHPAARALKEEVNRLRPVIAALKSTASWATLTGEHKNAC